MGALAAGIVGGGALLGGLLGGNAAKSAASTQANAQMEAARLAAEAQRFRPVGVTTAFGSSQFGTDAQGNVNEAGYTLSPELAAQRDAFLAQAGGAGMDIAAQAGQAGQGLFGLGQGYLAQSPEAAAQQWLQSQQAALAPGQERQLAGIRNAQLQQGRSGLAVGATDAGGMGASNPELQAYYNSLAQQNLGLQGAAQEQGRAQTQFGQGLLGAGIDLTSQGYNPYTTQFGLAQSLEQAGQGALDIGLNVGGRVTQAGSNVANTLFQGANNAANSMYAANAYSPLGTAVSGLSQNKELQSGLKNWMSPFGGTPQGAYGQQDQYLAGAYANPQTQQATMLSDQNKWFL
jgi:hypothetical protein